jgi:hypothetical protein
VVLFDLPEVKEHTAKDCPVGTFQVVVIPSLDVRKRSPLAWHPRKCFAIPAIESHTVMQYFSPNIPRRTRPQMLVAYGRKTIHAARFT